MRWPRASDIRGDCARSALGIFFRRGQVLQDASPRLLHQPKQWRLQVLDTGYSLKKNPVDSMR